MTIREASQGALLVALALMTACGSDSGDGAAAAVRDSAGVRIVENSAPLWGEGEGWRLSGDPIVEIGVLEGAPEYQLYRAFDGVRMSDGRIVVANVGTNELRVYDSEGRFVKSVGGEGGGPGEFKSIAFVDVFDGDSLVTFDWNNNRSQVFDPQVEFVRSLRFDPAGEGDATQLARPVAPFADGTFLTRVTRGFRPGDPEGVSRDSVLYLHHDRSGALIDSIGRLPGKETYVKSFTNRSITVTTLPFGRAPQLAVHGNDFWFGSSDTYEIRYYTGDGALQRLIRAEEPVTPVTDADIQRFTEDRLEVASEEWRPRLQQMLDEVSFPEMMPAYSNLVADDAGNLWVADYPGPVTEAHDSWNVFDPDGRLLGSVDIPPRFLVFQIGADFVLGLHRDEMEVERVRLYGLEKGTAVTRR